MNALDFHRVYEAAYVWETDGQKAGPKQRRAFVTPKARSVTKNLIRHEIRDWQSQCQAEREYLWDCEIREDIYCSEEFLCSMCCDDGDTPRSWTF